MRIPSLESERLRLEPLALTHSPGMFRLWKEEAVCRYSGNALDSEGCEILLPAQSPDDSDRLIEFWLARAQAGSGFRWALSHEGEFVGAVGFNALGACAEYAYHLHPDAWGAGLAMEASGLALSWVFARGAEAAEAFIEPANGASIRLVERLGFSAEEIEEGLIRYVLRSQDRGSLADPLTPGVQ